MKAKCFFCDTELGVVEYKFRVGTKEEPVCAECNLKTLNRRKASQGEAEP